MRKGPLAVQTECVHDLRSVQRGKFSVMSPWGGRWQERDGGGEKA